jgi:hypothetical protein
MPEIFNRNLQQKSSTGTISSATSSRHLYARNLPDKETLWARIFPAKKTLYARI